MEAKCSKSIFCVSTPYNMEDMFYRKRFSKQQLAFQIHWTDDGCDSQQNNQEFLACATYIEPENI